MTDLAEREDAAVDELLLGGIVDEVRAELTSGDRDDDAGSDGARRARALSLIRQCIARHRETAARRGLTPLGNEAAARYASEALVDLFGLGPLERLLRDETVVEIRAVGFDNVTVTYLDGRTLPFPRPLARSEAEFENILLRVATAWGALEHAWTNARPFLNMSLRLTKHRGWIVRKEIAGNTVAVFRRPDFVRLHSLALQRRAGSIDDELEAFLCAAVLAKKNILVSGGPGSGKTTMLRALANAIPYEERVVTIEDPWELYLDEFPERHRQVVPLQVRPENGEGEGGVDMAQLARESLRASGDRMIVGETRGTETPVMLEAMNQGNEGAMSSVHAPSPREALDKLAVYASRAGWSVETTALNAAHAIDFVVHMAKRPGGPNGTPERFVAAVIEVTGIDGGVILASDLWRPRPDGRAVRTDVGLTTRAAEDLVVHGYEDRPREAGNGKGATRDVVLAVGRGWRA